MDEDKLRALIVDVVGAGFRALEKQLHEKFESLALDVEDVAQRFDRLEVDLRSDMREIKLHLARLSREDLRDRRRIESVTGRLSALEQRLEAVEGKGESE